MERQVDGVWGQDSSAVQAVSSNASHAPAARADVGTAFHRSPAV